MAITEKLDKTDKKIKKVENKIEELQEQSIAMELLKYSKDQNELSSDNYMTANKRLFILLICSLIANLAIGGFFAYYVTNYTPETITDEAEANDGGNACIGDNCYNGDIDYGESKKDN